MKSVQDKRAVGWKRAIIVLLAVVLLAACAPSTPDAVAAWKPSTTQPEAAATSTTEQKVTEVPAEPSSTPTSTLQPSATPTVEPTATATVKPSATPVPTLGVAPDGFTMWCSPTKDGGLNQAAAQAPKNANLMVEVKGNAEVRIPATFCVAVYTLNQSVPDGTQLWMYDNSRAFLKITLTPDPANPQTAYAAVKHQYVVNPPYWQITYRLALVSADGKELRSDMVKFAKILPSNCPFGGLPNPVTLQCVKNDPWEVEPHPGVKYPYPTHTPSP